MRPQFAPFVSLFEDSLPRPARKPEMSVPPRVEKALQFLDALTDKTATTAVASENSIEQIPGQQLTDEEIMAQATACNLLTKYFAGQLKPDRLEKLKMQKMKKQTRKVKQEIPAWAICPHCLGKNDSCKYCH